MSSAEKRTVEDLIQVVWREGRLDELPNYWTTDCVNHAAPQEARRGLEHLRTYHAVFAEAFADFTDASIDIAQQVAEADRVVTQMRMTAKHAPSGRTVTLDSIRIDRFEGGKIAEHWSVADLAGLQRQLAG